MSQPLPFQAEAEAAHAAQVERFHAFCDSRPGVSWSALGPIPPRVDDIETIRRRLVEWDQITRAYQASPRGRFHAAATELWSLGYEAELRSIAQVIHACDRLNRSEDYQAHAFSVPSLFRAIRALSAINHPTAREAVQALCDLAQPSMAEAA